jgi:hypothetical protein
MDPSAGARRGARVADAAPAGVDVQTRRRDPNWSGWAFMSDIAFDTPVDLDELIDIADDAQP